MLDLVMPKSAKKSTSNFLHTDMVCLRQATVKVEQDEDVSEEAKKKRRVE